MTDTRTKTQTETMRSANELAAMEKLRGERRILAKRLASIRGWSPYFHLANKKTDLEKQVERIKRRLTEIHELERKAGKPKRKPRGSGVSIGGSLVEMLLQRNIPTAALAGVFQSAQTSGACPDLMEGTVERPTGIKEYFWQPSTQGSSESGHGSHGSFSWCKLQKQGYEDLPSKLVDQDTDAEAIGIDGFLREDPSHVLGGFPFGDVTINMMSTIVCFQYTFPVPVCNSTLEWSCWPSMHLPQGISMWGDDYYADFDVVVAEQREGGSFPDFDDFEWVEGGRIETDVSYSWSYGWRLSGQFNVQAGIQSKLCIGFATQLMVEDGEVDYHSVESDGIGPLRATRCIFTPTRVNMDFNDPAETWVRPGVGYKIRPR